MERDVLRDLVIDDREQGRFLVKRQALTDPAVLEIERREIFDRVWLYAGHESEIAEKNSYITRKVGGRPIILSRDKVGRVHAFFNSCPHRGNLVCRENRGTTKAFMCFYHAWTFSTDGALIGLPGQEAYGPAFDRNAKALRPVPRFESYRGLIFISYNADVADLRSYLGEAREYIDAALDFSGGDVEVVEGQQSYSIKANWKLLVENSIDGYHAASTHHRYFRNYLSDIGLKPMDLTAKSDMPSNIVSRGLAIPGGHSGIETNALATPLSFWAAQELGTIRADLERNLGTERAHWIADYNRNLFIFPNLIFISLWQTIRTFYPVAPDYMEIDAWALFPRGEDPGLRHKRLSNFLSFLGPAGFATPDDVAALEGCQKGFATGDDYSDISRGMLSEAPLMTDELQMRAFWRQWHHQIQGLRGHADVRDRFQSIAAE